MKKELLEKMNKEWKYMALLIIISLALIKLLFYNETLLVAVKFTLTLFWLFVIPGFMIMYLWEDSLGFAERLIIGSLLNAAIVGISSYYLGLFGLNIKYHGIILPIAIILISLVILNKKK